MQANSPFWRTMKLPIIGLSPMDGITDPAFRALIDTVGHPDILYTEFVSADGLCRNPRLLRTFVTHTTKTPIVGQLFGKDPGAMAEAAQILVEQTSVSGIDINMGCPARRVAHHGGGAALIQTPKIAEQLVVRVRDVILKSGRPIGLSVKTRIGYDTITTNEWISFLTTLPIDAIALHGRTLKEYYSGRAHWDELAKASRIAAARAILLLGNGDITSKQDAHESILTYTHDGVLIGRAALGNPWVFTNHTVTSQDRIDAAIAHCQFFDALTPTANPMSLRKHLVAYIKGFEESAKLRATLSQIQSTKEAITLLRSIPLPTNV